MHAYVNVCCCDDDDGPESPFATKRSQAARTRRRGSRARTLIFVFGSRRWSATRVALLTLDSAVASSSSGRGGGEDGFVAAVVCPPSAAGRARSPCPVAPAPARRILDAYSRTFTECCQGGGRVKSHDDTLYSENHSLYSDFIQNAKQKKMGNEATGLLLIFSQFLVRHPG